MRNILIAIGILTQMFFYTYDLGERTIQAVCRITALDGSISEGFITLIHGSYEGMHPNGFYFYKDNYYNGLVLYDLKAKSLNKIENNRCRFGNYQSENHEIYFAAHTWAINTYTSKSSYAITRDSLGKHLVHNQELKHKYKLFDSLPIIKHFQHGNTYIDYNHVDEVDKIHLKDIKAIEIITNPDFIWRDKIQKQRQEYNKSYENDDNYTGDYLEPLWYHEIIENPKLLKYIEERFRLTRTDNN